ncbi:MAG: hypothetical protein WCJ84_04265 [Candidatus Peregrinibacteria bacterium]
MKKALNSLGVAAALAMATLSPASAAPNNFEQGNTPVTLTSTGTAGAVQNLLGERNGEEKGWECGTEKEFIFDKQGNNPSENITKGKVECGYGDFKMGGGVKYVHEGQANLVTLNELYAQYENDTLSVTGGRFEPFREVYEEWLKDITPGIEFLPIDGTEFSYNLGDTTIRGVSGLLPHGKSLYQVSAEGNVGKDFSWTAWYGSEPFEKTGGGSIAFTQEQFRVFMQGVFDPKSKRLGGNFDLSYRSNKETTVNVGYFNGGGIRVTGEEVRLPNSALDRHDHVFPSNVGVIYGATTFPISPSLHTTVMGYGDPSGKEFGGDVAFCSDGPHNWCISAGLKHGKKEEKRELPQRENPSPEEEGVPTMRTNENTILLQGNIRF